MDRLPKTRPLPSRSRHRAVLMAAAFGASVLAASAAQAFTMDNTANTNSDGSAKYADPDSRFSSGASNNGQGKYNFGNTTLQFGTRVPGADQRYNTDRMFDPNGRPGDDR